MKHFASADDYANAIAAFFRERLEFYLREVLGLEYDTVKAVLAGSADDVVDAIARGQAVSAVRKSEDFEHISIAFKRIKNILAQARDTGKRVAPVFKPHDLREDAEKTLAAQVPKVAAAVEALRAKGNYAEALAEISKLRPTVDTFFDKVMVMVEDEHLRASRLALLEKLLNEFSTIADFSEIVTEGKSS